MYAIRRWKDVRKRITARAISASGGWSGGEGCRGMERSDGWKVRWVERRDARSLARFRAQQRGITGRLFHGRERLRRHGSRKHSGLAQRKNRREGPPISPTDLEGKEMQRRTDAGCGRFHRTTHETSEKRVFR